MMSEPDSEGERPALRQPPSPLVERREAARSLLRDVGGTMRWQGDDGAVDCEVAVLNISGGGAALLAEGAPPAGRALELSLHGESVRMGPIEGRVIETRPDASGKRVVHVRFARWIPLDWLRDKHRERRLWERYPARESRASLSWLEGADERTIRGELLNISGGGAAFASEMLPPPGVPLWFGLGAGAPQRHSIEAVESRLVKTSVDPSGRKIAHLQFIDPCPMDIFERAIHGSG